jgi:integrase/recombinase XerD
MPSYDKPNRSTFFNGHFYDKMAEDLQLTGKSQRTVYGYLRAVRQLADHCRKAPDKITEAELRRYFVDLKCKRQAAYGTQRVALSGIRFFYQTTCPRDWNVLAMLKLKNEKTLPEVVTREQICQIVLTATTQRMRVFLWTVYSLGLRLNEALHLEIGDIDAARKLVHIHRGKGAKDRYVPISQFTIEALRRYWLTHRHPKFLFPADGRNHTLATLPPTSCSQAKTPMSMTAPQTAIKKITRQLNFCKKVSIHTLRHSYATHLLEAHVSLRIIQQYLGHSSLMTTIEYLHLTDAAKQDARGTIEQLFDWKNMPGNKPNPNASANVSANPNANANGVADRNSKSNSKSNSQGTSKSNSKGTSPTKPTLRVPNQPPRHDQPKEQGR